MTRGADPRASPRRQPGWAPDMGRFAQRLAADLGAEGHPWPDVAAAVLTARGRGGLSRDQFAGTVRLPVHLLATLEDGATRHPGGPAMAPYTEQPLTTSRFVEALRRACEWHAHQTRKKDDVAVPYISHLLAVASLVLEDGGSEDEAIAGLLHDTVEDQGVSPATIEELFGPAVARMVLACSDAQAGPGEVKAAWRDRKMHHLAALGTLAAGDPVFRVTAADKLHNCRDTLADVREHGPARLEAFNGRTEGTLWYYAEMVALLTARLPDSRLTAALAREVRALHDAAGMPI